MGRFRRVRTETSEEEEQSVAVRPRGDLRARVCARARGRRECDVVGVRVWSALSRRGPVVGDERRGRRLGVSRVLPVELRGRDELQEG